jgi:RHS repeat-associated protein
MQWNCVGGVSNQATDENLNNVSTAYSDLNFWRPASLTDQLNTQTGLSYPDETAVEASLSFNSPTSVSDSRTTVDGFGRPVFGQRLQGPSSANYDTVETDYNSLGQPYRSTMPYAATASPTSSNTTIGATVRTYDALGRVLTVTDPDNGLVSYTYIKNDVLQTVSGTQSFQKQFEYDGLGRLKSVCEISTSLPGVGSCGQTATGQSGYWTQYTYTALGQIHTVTQNSQAASANQQTRTYSYDWMGRMTTEVNPESGTTTYQYDSVTPTFCGGAPTSSPGNLMQINKANGTNTCYVYDALHRLTDVGGVTTCRRFRYDKASGGYRAQPSGSTISNPAGRLVEAETDNCSGPTQITDEWFSYDKRGQTTDIYEETTHTSGYYHSQATYWANGTIDSLNLFNSTPTAMFPAINYGATDGSGLDGEGRVTKVTAASGEFPLKCCVVYSTGNASAPLGALTSVTYGSGDGDSFTYDPAGRIASYSFSVNGNTDAGTLTWNTNGTLQKLIINDQIPGTSDSQTCTYGYDDVQRISNVTCGILWVQNFSYDAFGNIKKNVPAGDGGLSFLPNYFISSTPPTGPTNQFATLPGATPIYDGAGNLLTDNLNTYTWDAYGKMTTVNTGAATVTAVYDALGRMVENNAGGSSSEFIYSPTGAKLAKVNGLALVNAFIGLPGGGKAIYNSSGVLAHYRHSDWLGSSRLTSTGTQTLYSSTAYAPFGEQYATSGTGDPSFTGQDQDTASSLYDFPARRQSPSQGRWISPDPAGLGAVKLTNPQSWNRYAYVLNNPLRLIDAMGLCSSDNNDDGSTDGDGDDDDDDARSAMGRRHPHGMEEDCNGDDNIDNNNSQDQDCSAQVEVNNTAGLSSVDLQQVESNIAQYFQSQAGLSITFTPPGDGDPFASLGFGNTANRPQGGPMDAGSFTQFFVVPNLSYVNTQYLALEFATVPHGTGVSLLQGVTNLAEHELTLNLSGGFIDDSGPDITADFSDSNYQEPSPDLNADEIATLQDVNNCPIEGDVGGNQGPLDPGSPVVSAVKRRKGHIF